MKFRLIQSVFKPSSRPPAALQPLALPFVMVAAVSAALSGCSIPYADALSNQFNSCESDIDCPAGSHCAAIGDQNSCVASSVDLTGLVIEVRPAPGNGQMSLSSILIEPGSISGDSGSQIVSLDLKVPEYINVSPGRVYLPCAGSTAVPARVNLKPVPHLFGLLEGQLYEAASEEDSQGNEAFAVSVPPGTYDVYVEPQPDLALFPDCAKAPPIFLPAQTLSKDTGFSVQAGAPLTLNGTIKLSQKEDFTKWYLEVVEPVSGQIISESIQPKQEGLDLEVPFSIAFDWTATNKAFIPVVRLRPPAGSSKPFILWSLDVLAFQGLDVPVKLDVSGIATQPREVGGNVFHDGVPVTATVTLQSTSLSGEELTLYETVIQTDDNGHFQSFLPPGTYQVVARPAREDLAVGATVWEVAEGTDCFCGGSVNVPFATTLAGTVVTANDDSANVEVRLMPSITGGAGYLSKATAAEVKPRPATTQTQAGVFQVPVDSGKFDLALVPPSDSGYPWLVRPRLLVSEIADDLAAPPVVSLGTLALQNPVIVRGRVLDAKGSALPGATIRAWTPVGGDEAAKSVTSAVQIGEAVADVNGEYFLLLPPSVK